jgi:hypothetical protein
MRLLHVCPVLFLFLLPSASRLPAEEFIGPHVLPGGITDAEGRTGFFATPEGGIDAVDLATGQVLWQTVEAQRPLFVRDDRLYAVAAVKKKRPWRFLGFKLNDPPPGPHGFCVRAFAVHDEGNLVLESDVVDMPEWVSVQDVPGQVFATRWQVQEDSLVLNWEVRSWYAGSKRPTPQMAAGACQHLEGALRVLFASGATTAVAPASQPAHAPAWPFAKDLEGLAVRWQGVCGASYKALVLEAAGGKETLVLRSWDYATHAVQGAKELAQGKTPVVLATTDERFLCVREALPSPDQTLSDKERQGCDWTVFRVETGERMASLPYVPGTQSVTVIDDRAYLQLGGRLLGRINQPFNQPRTLRTVALKSGRTLWERPIPSKVVIPPPVP